MPTATTRPLLALAPLLAATSALAPAASSDAHPGPRPPRLHGHVSGALPEGFGEYVGDEVRFTIDAQGDPLATTGRFTALHLDPDGGPVVAEFAGDITCLMVAGEIATATGVITSGFGPSPDGQPTDVTGHEVSFTVHDDGRRDRMYWMWGFLGAPINECQGLAPVFEPSRGDLSVRPGRGHAAAGTDGG